jgi:hypothetical protein
MSTESGIEKLFERSRFIFRGKVLKVGTSNLKSLKAEERTAVVGVEKVYRAAPALQALAGTEVTVLLQTPGSVAEGQSTVFFTNGWQYGERVAVREEGQSELCRASRRPNRARGRGASTTPSGGRPRWWSARS